MADHERVGVKISRCLGCGHSPKLPLSFNEDDFRNHLAMSQTSLKILRGRIQCCWLVLALTFGLGIDVWYTFDDVHNNGKWAILVFMEGPLVANLVVDAVFKLRLVLLALAPLDDTALSRFMIFIDMFVVFVVMVIDIFYNGNLSKPWMCAAVLLVHVACVCAFVIFFVAAVLATSIDDAQRRLWWGLGLYACNDIWLRIVWSLHEGEQLTHHLLGLCFVLVPMPLLLVALRPAWRKCAQGYVLQRMQGRADTQGAASLACLIGRVSPDAILARSLQATCQTWPTEPWRSPAGSVPAMPSCPTPGTTMHRPSGRH